MWHVYILKCADGTFYTGLTVDLKRRVGEHNNSRLGAKYTRSRRPVKLIYSQKVKTRSRAARLEYQIKKMTRPEKIKLIQTGPRPLKK
jgi:putative endonuclease